MRKGLVKRLTAVGALRLVAVLAFGFAAGLAAAVFLAAGAFLVAVALVVVSFFGLPTAAFFGAAALVAVGEVFYRACQRTDEAAALDDYYLCGLFRLRSRRRCLYTRFFLMQLDWSRSTYQAPSVPD